MEQARNVECCVEALNCGSSSMQPIVVPTLCLDWISVRVVDDFVIRVKKAETPFYARLKRMGKLILTLPTPVPRFLDPLFSAVEALHGLSWHINERLAVTLYRYPVLRNRCEQIGPGLEMELIPGIVGPVQIWLGESVRLSGRQVIAGARVLAAPKLIVGNRVFIGNGVSFSIAQEIRIDDDVLIAGDCIISDYSGHPTNPEERLAGVQVSANDVKPIHIGKNAWIGRRAIILPGVVIGENAIVGAGAVVTKSVPPNAMAVGNPARIPTRDNPQNASSSETFKVQN
jgi:acetyltransferase-like isoleucine patch superfamily enzyme